MATKQRAQAPSKNGKPTKAPRARRGRAQTDVAPKKPKKLSALDAAARVLAETKQPMSCPELIEAMATKGYWKSPAGKTPHATLYAAMQREINTKGKDARFKKADRGQFALAKALAHAEG